MYVLAHSALPGVCEETLFRGAILGVLERRGTCRAVLITAVLFAAWHVTPDRFFTSIGSGLVLGLLTVRTGSILPAIVMHTSLNACIVLNRLVTRAQMQMSPGYGEFVGIPVWIRIALVLMFVVLLVEFVCHTSGPQPRPSPLASRTSGMSPRARLALARIGIVSAVLLAVSCLFVTVERVAMAGQYPGIRRGDFALILRARYVRDLAAGSVVAVKTGSQVMFYRVVSADGNRIRAECGEWATNISRRSLFGKVWFTFRL